MLAGLTITNIVLIEQLSLEFRPGLSALTGETGAGKSILLDSLGLALGSRAESRLVRDGSGQGSVTAEFLVPPGHAARRLLAEADIPVEDGEPIVIRRILGNDGRSRAAINDQPVSVGLLRQLGQALAEIHGQFETQGLRDPASHLPILDLYAGEPKILAAVEEAWRRWRELDRRREEARRAVDGARAEETFLRHAAEELGKLAPEPGEEESLAGARARLRGRDALHEALAAALSLVDGDGGARTRIGGGLRRLERLDPALSPAIGRIIDALTRADAELELSGAELSAQLAALEDETTSLEEIEERLFALRAAARKYGVEADALAAHRAAIEAQLAQLEDEDASLDRIAAEAQAAKDAYVAAAERLRAARSKAARALSKAVMAELPPLKLDRARFEASLTPSPEPQWGPKGFDQVGFLVAANPGATPGPLDKIASGGELARLMLAIKVVLAEQDSVATMVFDEVDSGIGGAAADAVGERLDRLGRRHQVLVVTHSPQVAAKASAQWQVSKAVRGGRAVTHVALLDPDARREEIARMLSGAVVTEQARAAADSLLTPPDDRLLV